MVIEPGAVITVCVVKDTVVTAEVAGVEVHQGRVRKMVMPVGLEVVVVGWIWVVEEEVVV